MSKNSFIIVLFFICIFSNLHSGTVDVIENDIYYNTDKQEKIQITKDKKVKEFIRKNKSDEKVLYNNKNDYKYNKSTKVFKFNVFNIKNKKNKRFGVSYALENLQNADWIDDEKFYVYGQTGYRSDIFQVYYMDEDYNRENVTPSYLLFGRRFSISENHSKIAYLNLLTRAVDPEKDSDCVFVFDLKNKIVFKEKQFFDAESYSKYVYPLNSPEKYQNLEERHNIISDLIWVGNDKILFVDNYKNKSHLIIIYISNKFESSKQVIKVLTNNYVNILEIEKTSDGFLIKGKLLNSGKESVEDVQIDIN